MPQLHNHTELTVQSVAHNGILLQDRFNKAYGFGIQFAEKCAHLRCDSKKAFEADPVRCSFIDTGDELNRERAEGIHCCGISRAERMQM